MKQILLFIMALFCLSIIYVGCANDAGPVNVAGGGSETETGFIRGTLASSTGQKKSDVQVVLYSVDYNPISYWYLIDSIRGFSDTTMTDSNGFFQFDTVVKGTYNLVALDTILNEGIYIDSIDNKDTNDIKFGTLTMFKNGIISGEAPYTKGIYIKGTGLYLEKPEGTSHFSINQVPPGNYNMTVVYILVGGPVKPSIKDIPSITVVQDSTTVIDTVKFH